MIIGKLRYMNLISTSLLLAFSLLAAVEGKYSSQLCLADCSSGSCIFDLKVNLTAGQWGYFHVDGCEGVNPTLAMEIGTTYTFLQHQYENYYHPLGFAYFPDGAHDGVDELEPGIPPPNSGSDCNETLSCPAPMYFLNGKYLGTYSNDADVLTPSSGESNFGLDDYEPVFFYPFEQWLEFGKFSINLKFDQYYDQDIFYFCHIHQFMTGRIKLLEKGVPTQPDADLPEIPYEYDQPSEFDKSCGSFGITDFQLPNPQCPEKFVCNPDGLSDFASCIEAQNCHMFVGMTTGAASGSAVALFLHQMIPHHENAINMAKTLLYNSGINCEVYDESPDCTMYAIGLEIVSDQNFQVQVMRGLLDEYGFNATNDCIVPVSSRYQQGYAHYDNRRTEDMELFSVEKQVTMMKEKKARSHALRKGKKESRTLTSNGNQICVSETGRYTVNVDLHAGELGYFTFEECGDEVNPTIGIEIGKTYFFDQGDRTNHYHPLEFGYFPDGSHTNLDTLSPGTPPYGTSSKCAADYTCPAPMYLVNDAFVGKYSNIPDVLESSSGESNNGLDEYRPLFSRPIVEWSASNYSLYLNFDNENFESDIFYYSGNIQYMSGRVKLLKNGIPINPDDMPEIPYKYDNPGKFDSKCGSFGLDNFQLPNEQCFEPFVCNVLPDDSDLELYAECIEAMNCHMLAGMTTKATSMSGVALFIHHMVPHHQNAVNMVKATLKLADYKCDDLTLGTSDCVLEQILRDIVNSQNKQIQLMYEVLELSGFPKTDDCVVTFTPSNGGGGITIPEDDVSSDDGYTTDDEEAGDDHSDDGGESSDDDQGNGDDESHDDGIDENDDNHSDDDGSTDDHSDDDGSNDDHSDDDGANDDHSDDDGSNDDHGDDDDDDGHSDGVSVTVNFIGGKVPHGHSHDLSIALSKALNGESRRLRNSKHGLTR